MVSGHSCDPDQALATADVLGVDVLVTDQMMPGMTGLELIGQLRARGFRGSTVLCSAFVDDGLVRAARDVGVDVCLSKADQGTLPQVIRGVAA